MNKIKRSVLLLVSVFLIVYLGGSLTANTVRADTHTFTDYANVSISEILNGTIDLKANPDTEVAYGDVLKFKMSWTIADGTPIVKNDEYIYTLPDKITFTNSSGTLDDLGTYKIEGNTITIIYTDDGFCGDNTNRVGSLKFEGRINDDGDGGLKKKDIHVTFPVGIDVTFHMIPPANSSTIEVYKEFNEDNGSLEDHDYFCDITILSKGANTNVKIEDMMWPGMYLYESPVFLYPDGTPLENTRYTDNTEAPSTANREIKATINSMGDNEMIIVRYKVKVIDDMYNWDDAKAYVSQYDWLYPYSYGGNVPNRVTVSSEQFSGMTAWADIRTLKAVIGKWESLDDNNHKEGLLGWRVVIYDISAYSYTSAYMIEKLPKNNSLVESSVKVTCGGTDMTDAISINKTTTASDEVRFDFDSSLLDYLKTDGNEAVITFQTKVEKQESTTDHYYNYVYMYYDNTDDPIWTGADVNYTKPAPVTKDAYYTEATAPYVDYKIVINPASLDLVDGIDELTLTDEMSSSYDLLTSSVTINGSPATDSEFKYDVGSRTMTFTLVDEKAYVIEYKAAVNLVPGSKLDENNSGNTAYLTANGSELGNGGSILKCDVYASAGSSSSDPNLCVLNIIKHVDGDIADTLSGATFTLTSMNLKSSGEVTSVSDKEASSDSNGYVTFKNISRGTVYMLTETIAPEGYDTNKDPQFYVFSTSGATYPSSVTYDGTAYTLTVIDSGKISYDLYYGNVKATPTPEPTDTPTPTPSATPTEATPDGSSGGGSSDNNDSKPSVTPTTTPTATPVATPATNKSSTSTSDKKTTSTGEAPSNTSAFAVVLIASSAALAVFGVRKRKP